MSDTPMDNTYWSHPSPDTSPQAIWALLRESAENHEKAMRELQEMRLQIQENDRQRKKYAEEHKEQQREIALQMKETDRRMKETDKKIGELGNRFGELAEHLVAPNIMERFNSLGFTFESVSHSSIIKDRSGNSVAEIDLILENDDMVIAIEVKSKPARSDIKDHIRRMEVLRRRADARGDKRKLIGAMAGAIMSGELRNNIIKSGFYAIEQTGDTVKISNPQGFTPRQW